MRLEWRPTSKNALEQVEVIIIMRIMNLYHLSKAEMRTPTDE
ncbi:hypothetical protein TR2A62_0861 [Thalassobium sp. R2A62]|nr:hypothetical protein TR2A62_0861 [Thalassobium sp. R2A62]